VYLGFSAVALALAAVALWRSRAGSTTDRIEVCAALAVLTGVGLLALLSLAFVFAGTVHPSPDYPFFSNGRLIGGVLVPFCLLLLRGLEFGTGFVPEPMRPWVGWSVLAGVLAVAFVSEITLAAPVFASAYNAYHLP
jgi:hypothetical protein